MINRCDWNKVRLLTPSWKSMHFDFDVNVKGVDQGSVLIKKNPEQKCQKCAEGTKDESRCREGGEGGVSPEHMKYWCERGEKLERRGSCDERVH